MKPATLTYLLAPMGAMAGPCRHKPSSSSAVEVISSATSASTLSTTPTSAPDTSSTVMLSTTAAPTTTQSVTASASAPASASASVSTTSPTSTSQPTATDPAPSVGAGIDALFRAKGKLYFGTAADSGTLSKARNAAIINSDFGQLTPENSMKWDAIEPSRGRFDFAGADALVAYAGEHGLSVRGHTLLWHQQLPSYVSAITDAGELASVIENHISTVVGRYKGKVRAWVSHIIT